MNIQNLTRGQNKPLTKMDACEKCDFIYVKMFILHQQRRSLPKKCVKGFMVMGQCIVYITLKLQATLHFSHNCLGLVCSCSIVQLPFNCSPSPISLFTQVMVPVNVGFPHHSLLGDLFTSSFSSFGGDGCLFLIFLSN